MFGGGIPIDYSFLLQTQSFTFNPNVAQNYINATISNSIQQSVSSNIQQSVSSNINQQLPKLEISNNLCSLQPTNYNYKSDNSITDLIVHIISPKLTPAPYTYKMTKEDTPELATLKSFYNNLAADIFDGTEGVNILSSTIQHETLKRIEKNIEKHCMPK